MTVALSLSVQVGASRKYRLQQIAIFAAAPAKIEQKSNEKVAVLGDRHPVGAPRTEETHDEGKDTHRLRVSHALDGRPSWRMVDALDGPKRRHL
jgi:hypothetical protein